MCACREGSVVGDPVAVSKNHPASTVAEAVALGVTLFGKNRIQEAKAKIPASPGRARWHFIGHLRSPTRRAGGCPV